MLEPATSGSGFSSWPTARGEDAESCGNHPGSVDSLGGGKQVMEDPARHERNGSNRETGRRRGVCEAGNELANSECERR